MVVVREDMETVRMTGKDVKDRKIEQYNALW